jgi:very-short-patch-repair endonuclease
VPDRARITLHRVGTLRDAERTTHDAIPVTTPARTLLDLASRLRARALEDAIAQMVRLDLFDLVAVRRCLAAHPRQHGAPALKRLLERLAGRDPADLRSATEIALAQLCDDHDLPEPATNVQIEGFTVDFHWPGTTLVVEGDGYTYHNMPAVFESDRDRDQRLLLAGYTVARFTYPQLTREPEESARRLRGLLTRCGSPEGELFPSR